MARKIGSPACEDQPVHPRQQAQYGRIVEGPISTPGQKIAGGSLPGVILEHRLDDAGIDGRAQFGTRPLLLLQGLRESLMEPVG
jgi:hypothetical protein